jgi:signal peptidase I
MNETDAVTIDESAPAQIAPKAAPSAAKSAGAEWLESAWTLAVALAALLVIRVAVVQPFTIPSASMEPNLVRGDYILVTKFAYGLSRHSIPFSPPLFHGRLFGRGAQRGDIVVFKLPRDGRTDYIKRIIGLPGDRIQMRGGQVFLNGQPVPRHELAPVEETSPFGFSHKVQRFLERLPEGRSYVTDDYGPEGEVDNTDVYVVPAGHYFVMGDNRDNSADSRYPEYAGVGFVPEENLVGKAQLILFSVKGLALRPDRLFKPLH